MGAPEAFTTTTDVGHYIGGRTVAGTSGRQQAVYNPATGAVARQVALASTDEVAAAVARPPPPSRPGASCPPSAARACSTAFWPCSTSTRTRWQP